MNPFYILSNLRESRHIIIFIHIYRLYEEIRIKTIIYILFCI